MIHDDAHDHDHGLTHDLVMIERLRVGRRRALFLLGGAGGAALLTGCGGGGSDGSGTVTIPSATPTPTPTSTPTPTPSSSSGSCTVPASETNGPYPADGTNQAPGLSSNALTASGVIRSDIRSSFIGSSTAVAAGIQVDITITLVDANNGCTPLAGYAVYLWQCDAAGRYSLYNLPNESYLRGVQVSDAGGQVTFTTIFPGCYAGRYPHLHFEIFSSAANATGGRYAVLISQFALPAAQCDAVYATSAYSASVANYRNTSLSTDDIFSDNSSAQMAVMMLQMSGDTASGYDATTTIAIAT